MRKVESAYLTQDHTSIFCGGRGRDVGQHVNVNTLNKLQQVPWSINEDILHLLSDTLKPSEKPISALEQRNREISYNLRDRETNDVIDYLLENGNKFYFNWKLDARGRMYSQGYHINIQGNEYRKAMLSFANKELLTEEGIRYLKIDIANHYGLDKLTWTQRLFRINKVLNTIFLNKEYEDRMVEASKEADSPLLFIKAVTAYKGVILGEPIGHNMSLDSTASGLQIMSALSGCEVTARNCNVHTKVERKYTDEVQQRLEELEEELAKAEH